MTQPYRPPILVDDAAKPYNSHPALRNLVGNLRLLSVLPWLEEATFDEVVEMWWYAQSRKAEKLEMNRKS